MGVVALAPLDVRPLFPGLHAELLSVLEGMGSADWNRPTLAGEWTVRDVVAHLVDGDLRRLSFERDGQAIPPPPRPFTGEADLVAFLNELNADWVRVARRLSPRVLLDLLKSTGLQAAALFASLSPESPAFFSVAWAGESSSKSWFDVGREYTERWHHQQQVRLAVGAPLLNEPRWLKPVVDLSMRALPHRYAGTTAPEGASVLVEIRGPSGGVWSLVRRGDAWSLFAGRSDSP
ncbi:MAG TPA: maleylpyruvate isomerase N-terminal domain-containing protein, partial [Vicinamibacteria bacterium]|nr:maleylpyruvate isomerase N-terminal domain-containing protein [Vicinamibacteria bacterium]